MHCRLLMPFGRCHWLWTWGVCTLKETHSSPTCSSKPDIRHIYVNYARPCTALMMCTWQHPLPLLQCHIRTYLLLYHHNNTHHHYQHQEQQKKPPFQNRVWHMKRHNCANVPIIQLNSVHVKQISTLHSNHWLKSNQAKWLTNKLIITYITKKVDMKIVTTIIVVMTRILKVMLMMTEETVGK